MSTKDPRRERILQDLGIRNGETAWKDGAAAADFAQVEQRLRAVLDHARDWEQLEDAARARDARRARR